MTLMSPCLRTQQLQTHQIQRPLYQTRDIPSGWAVTDLKDSSLHRLPLLHMTVSSMPLKKLALEAVSINTTRTEKENILGLQWWTLKLCYLCILRDQNISATF